MASEAEFPRSPLRDYDPFGQKTGENPFSEPPVAEPAASSPDENNIYAASSSLAEPAPKVEYEAVLEPRILVLTSTAAIGLTIAVIATILLFTYPPEAGELAAHGILFPISLALFFGAVLLAQFDLKAMRLGAMKRDAIETVRRWRWLSWIGMVYSIALEVFCLWPLLESLFHRAFG